MIVLTSSPSRRSASAWSSACSTTAPQNDQEYGTTIPTFTAPRIEGETLLIVGRGTYPRRAMAAVAQPEVEPARALDELYDFAVRVTRDHDAAARVVLTVVDRVDDADAESATWLYGVARDVALEQ